VRQTKWSEKAARQGFSLVELLAVVALASVAMLLMVSAYKKVGSQVTAQVAAGQQDGRELAQFAAAVREWANQKSIKMTADTATDVSVASLIASGYLPANFANHAGGVGHNLIGQSYMATAIKSSGDGKTRAVAWLMGPALQSLLAAQDIGSTNATITARAEAVASEVNANSSLAAGVIQPGNTHVRGVTASFTYDVSPWIGSTALTLPSAVALVGFSELVPDGSDTPSTTPPPQVDIGNCYVAQPSVDGGGNFVAATCSAGTHEEARWSFCKPYNSANLDDMAKNFPGGIIVSGKDHRYYNEVLEGECWVAMAYNYPCPHLDRDDDAVYSLGTPFFRETCIINSWGDCPGREGDTSYRCLNPRPAPVLASYPAQAFDLLCCH